MILTFNGHPSLITVSLIDDLANISVPAIDKGD